jgi:hypothetical protein
VFENNKSFSFSTRDDSSSSGKVGCLNNSDAIYERLDNQDAGAIDPY